MTATLISPDATGPATSMVDARPESFSPPTTRRPTPRLTTSAGDQPGSDPTGHDLHGSAVAAVNFDRGQTVRDPQSCATPVEHSTPDAMDQTTPIGRARPESISPPAKALATPKAQAPAGSSPWDDPALLMAADLVDDLEDSRKAFANRRGALERAGLPDVTGYAPGMGTLAESLAALEKQAIKELERAVRRHPLAAWVKGTPGIGEKQIGRLLSCIGDPYVRQERVDLDSGEVIEPSRARTLAELRSYCGVGDAREQVRRKGHKANWNATAKMRLWNVAQSCVKAKATSPYGPVYDAARERYADAVHDAPCVRCGPAGRPAETGTPLSRAHQHARAVRAVMKAVLRDLWTEARDIHEKENSVG